MKTMLVLAVALIGWSAMSNEGILPGEPDPNTAPGRDNVIVKGGKHKKDRTRDDVALIDDRKSCPKGQKRYQVYHCVPQVEIEPDCKNFHAVFECSNKPLLISCEKPKVLKPLYKCEAD